MNYTLIKNGKNNQKLAKTAALHGVTLGYYSHSTRSCVGADCNNPNSPCYFCYGRKGFFRFKNVKNNLDFCYNKALKDLLSFESTIVAELYQMRPNFFRIHVAGDFFSQAYLETWKSIVKLFPDTIFYAYTKSHQLNFQRLPKNLRIIRSLGSKYDHLIPQRARTCKVFDTLEDLQKAGYTDCQEDDLLAITCKKLGIVKH